MGAKAPQPAPNIPKPDEEALRAGRNDPPKTDKGYNGKPVDRKPEPSPPPPPKKK